MTVNKAYGLLKQEGYICIDRRHGAKVQPTIDNSHEHQEKLLDELELLASEAIVKGMNLSLIHIYISKSLNHFHLNHHNTDLPVLLIA